MAWLDDRLAESGIKRTGAVEQPHLRPWATALRAPTTHGPVWLKAAGQGTAFEVGLYEILQDLAPPGVLTPLALDVGRLWVLLPDGGRPLGERVDGTGLVEALASVLPRYGKLQRELEPRVGEILALGVSDMRPARMPERFDAAVEAVRENCDPDQATQKALTALREPFTGWCERLEALPGEASLDHNDLHPWNMIVADGDPPGAAHFYDWGDSVVAHPFACMLVPLTWVGSRLSEGFGSPEVQHVRDAYLEAFGDLGEHDELVEALELACNVAKAARALVWHRILSAEGYDGEHAGAPLETMQALLTGSYLGGA